MTREDVIEAEAFAKRQREALANQFKPTTPKGHDNGHSNSSTNTPGHKPDAAIRHPY